MNKKEISGWGNYPKLSSRLNHPLSKEKISSLLQSTPLTPRGLARSYGDSAIGWNTASSTRLNKILSFDSKTGILTAESGVSIEEIIRCFVPRGWFPPVVPGTKYVSIGGAIAADIHGKNHHREGSICKHIHEIEILRSDCPEPVKIYPGSGIFDATTGGMGLTGYILSAKIQLKKISSSFIEQHTLTAANLEELLSLFEDYSEHTYNVAWIDGTSTGSSLGRGVMMAGEYSSDGRLQVHKKSKLSVPMSMPSFTLNPLTISAFNELYYRKAATGRRESIVHYEPFFFPLDGIRNWNRLYGSSGFLQYQFLLPLSEVSALEEILELFAKTKSASFLAVLKRFGPGSSGYLSFPSEGYTLALDFCINPKIFKLLEEIDQKIVKHGGKIYLAKDARMSAATFRQTYPLIENFVEQMDPQMTSLGAIRLGLR